MGGLKNLCPFQELLLPPAASFPKAEFGVLHCISLFGRPAETGRTGDPGLPSEDVIEPKLQMGATCSLGGAAREREGRVGGSVEKSPPFLCWAALVKWPLQLCGNQKGERVGGNQ